MNSMLNNTKNNFSIRGLKFSAWILLLSVLLSLSACFSYNNTTNTISKNQSTQLYNPYMYKIHPEYMVYHQFLNKTLLYTKIYLSELMFSPIGNRNNLRAKVKIEYKVYSPENLKQVIDSASSIFNVRKQKGNNNIISYIRIKPQTLGKYYLKITTTDMNRGVKAQKYLFVDVQSSKQSFLIISKRTAKPYFKNYVKIGSYLSIQYSLSIDSLYIKFYNKKIPMPNPPFSSLGNEKFDTRPDSTWTVDGNIPYLFHANKKGFYFFQTNKNSKDGLGIICPGPYFPYIKTSEQMLYPLEYLSSKAKFEEMLHSDNKKLAVDRFWLKSGKTPAIARELIRIYYNRILYANIYFTSFTEGWRTDRGMIYILFGPPKAVKKSAKQEIWIYSDQTNYKVLQFVFDKTENSFSDNNYTLRRFIDFKSFWFKAIKSWENGKVYSIFN